MSGRNTFTALVVTDVCSFVSDFIIGTVHKAKGLEFETVMVTDDFAKVPSSEHNLHHNPNFSFGMFLWTNLFFLFLHVRILHYRFLVDTLALSYTGVTVSVSNNSLPLAFLGLLSCLLVSSIVRGLS